MSNCEEEQRPAFSVVIPTWNEQGWLPGLLSNLQRFSQIAEVIVADNNSTDATPRIAKCYGARLVEGGTPAVARNSAMKYAQSDFILFVDADAAIPRGAMRRVSEAFTDDRNVGIHFPLTPIGATIFVRLCYLLMDAYFGIMSSFGISQGVGTFMAVRKSAFYAVGGFDETLGPGEDVDFMIKLGKHGRVEYDRSARIGTSSRRFHIEAPLIFTAKTSIWAILRLFRVSSSIGGYIWKAYPEELGRRDSVLYADFIAEQEGGALGVRCGKF